VKIKKLLIEAPPAGVGSRKQFCYSRNYNIKVVISYIIKNLECFLHELLQFYKIYIFFVEKTHWL